MASNLEACSDNFLVKSICYLSSCIPVSSRAFADLPSQSINCPFPLVEHTYRKCESLWEGFKTIDVPPELTIHMLSRTLRLVILSIADNRVAQRRAHFYYFEFKKEQGKNCSQKQAHGALGKEEHEITEVFIMLSRERHYPESKF